MSSTQVETKQTEPPSTTGRLPRTIAKTLLGIGAAWARYGLTLGRASMEAYARTLQSTSGLLAELADAFERKAASTRGASEPPRPSEPVLVQPPPAQA